MIGPVIRRGKAVGNALREDERAVVQHEKILKISVRAPVGLRAVAPEDEERRAERVAPRAGI